MKITPSFLDELRSRLSPVEVIGRRVKLQKKGRDWLGLCPFHNEKTPSFTVAEDKGFYHCFGCGAHGDVVEFVKESENLSFPEAVEKLAHEAGMEIPRDTPADRAREVARTGLIEAMEAACAWFENQLRAATGETARRYLGERGLDGATARAFRLGYAPDARAALKGALMAAGFAEERLVEAGLVIRPPEGDRATYDRFRGRLMFPIRDRRGRVIAFGGRILGSGEPKYLNSPETPLFHKGRTLYNIDRAAPAARKSGQLVVAEGYMDVIALVRAGIGGAVAPLGTALTEDQIQALWKLAEEPVLCFDGDRAGQSAAARAADRALPLLSPGRSLRFAILPPGEDPDSLLRAQGGAVVASLVDAARPLVDVLWEVERDAAPLDTPERKAAFKKRLYDKMRRIGDGTVRDLYIGEFRRRLDDLFGASRESAGRRPPPRRGGPMDRSPPPGLRRTHNVEVLELRLQQALVATMIRRPELVGELGEEFGLITLHPPELDSLRREILKTWRFGLDSKGLESHLRGCGLAGTLDGVLARNVYVLAPFSRADAPLDEARDGWLEAWQRLRRRQHEVELSEAERLFAGTMTGENWARVEALRRLIGSGNGDGTDRD